MSDLTREQVELLFQQIWDINDQASGEALLDHDQAQRQRMEQLEREFVNKDQIIASLVKQLATMTAEVDQLNNVLRQAGWGQGEIDSAAYTFDKLAKANTALVAERDRLRDALAKLADYMSVRYDAYHPANVILSNALRGEPGGG